MSAIPGLSDAQQANASAIISVAKQEFPDPIQQRRAALIGIITAITESGLNNVPYGDRDSVGLFQQRSTWGTTAQRMDPTTSAQLFYARLKKVPNWDTIDPGAAAQAVQVSAYPDRYDQHLTLGNTVVSFLLNRTGTVDPTPSSGSSGTNLLGIPNSLFTPQFWARFGVGVLGAFLALFALLALVKNSDTGSAVIQTVKEAI